MRYLLDTTILSEFTKPQQDEAILQWLTTADTDSLWLSTITLFEIRVGIEALPSGRKKQLLSRWLEEEVREEYFGRILPVDMEVADKAGRLVAKAKAEGWNALEMDSLIAATALVHGMSVATINQKHFEWLGVELVRF